MLRVSFKRVKAGKVDKLRAWMRQLGERRDEVRESFDQEGVRQESAWLIEDGQGHVLVYAIEAEDLERAQQAYRESTLPIDLEHRAVLRDVLGARVEPELLYDLAVEEATCVPSSDGVYKTGGRLLLRQSRLEDAPERYRWFADPDVTRYLPLAGKGELPMDDVRAYLSQVSASTRPVLDMGIDLRDGTPIGSASYRDFVEGESAELSIVLGAGDARGRGYGREAMGLMLDYGFEDLGLDRVWLVVRADNAVAADLFVSLGFEMVDVLEGAVVVDGVARDKLRMELFAQQWLSSNEQRHQDVL